MPHMGGYTARSVSREAEALQVGWLIPSVLGQNFERSTDEFDSAQIVR